jgi:hypothetical protein
VLRPLLIARCIRHRRRSQTSHRKGFPRMNLCILSFHKESMCPPHRREFLPPCGIAGVKDSLAERVPPSGGLAGAWGNYTSSTAVRRSPFSCWRRLGINAVCGRRRDVVGAVPYKHDFYVERIGRGVVGAFISHNPSVICSANATSLYTREAKGRSMIAPTSTTVNSCIKRKSPR